MKVQIAVRLPDDIIAFVDQQVRGLSTEVSVGAINGLDHDAVVSCDNITTVPRTAIGRLVGYLKPEQEPELARHRGRI
jgi:mRNA interferase MazF